MLSDIHRIFTPETMAQIFPPNRSDYFFEALFGAADEGAYDILLVFKECKENALEFEFHLKQRPGKCLACNLTYGLPQVFSRHPIININGIVNSISKYLQGKRNIVKWQLGNTKELSRKLHVIPLTVFTS